jgi:hypothetical protein
MRLGKILATTCSSGRRQPRERNKDEANKGMTAQKNLMVKGIHQERDDTRKPLFYLFSRFFVAFQILFTHVTYFYAYKTPIFMRQATC